MLNTDRLIECASLGIIQDIPVEMTNLQNQNSALVGNYKSVRNTFITFIVLGTFVIGGYIIYKKYKDDNKK